MSEAREQIRRKYPKAGDREIAALEMYAGERSPTFRLLRDPSFQRVAVSVCAVTPVCKMACARTRPPEASSTVC